MQEKFVIVENDKIYCSLPLTSMTGKVRLKKRRTFLDYGISHAGRKFEISADCYLEWQIGYDLLYSQENLALTLLKDFSFINNKGEKKLPYELFEIVYYSYKFSLITKDELKACIDFVKSEIKTLDSFEELEITRTYPKESVYNTVDFLSMKVLYPLLIHKFKDYEVSAEIFNKEKQRAVGVQPMLYLCIPITKLKSDTELIGRLSNVKELVSWEIKRQEAILMLKLVKIFVMLSPRHLNDIRAIVKILWNDID